jgi:hypothetical protein
VRAINVLKFLLGSLPIVSISLLSSSVFAQTLQRQPRRIEDFTSSAFDCHRVKQGATDPVSSRLAQVYDCYSGGLIALAEEISAEKYSQRVFTETLGHNLVHSAGISAFACSKMSGVAAPKSEKIDVVSDKNDVVEFLKSSREFCKQAFSKLSDAKLGEPIAWNGIGSNESAGKTVTRFAAALWVTDTLIERYGAIASYTQTHGTLQTLTRCLLSQASGTRYLVSELSD